MHLCLMQASIYYENSKYLVILESGEYVIATYGVMFPDDPNSGGPVLYYDRTDCGGYEYERVELTAMDFHGVYWLHPYES